MPHAHFGQARLAPVAQDHGQTRHACRRTSGGDRKPEIVNIKAAQDHKIGHASARSEICSRIVESCIPCVAQARGIHFPAAAGYVKQDFLAVLWRKHDMVLALPCRVIQVILIL